MLAMDGRIAMWRQYSLLRVALVMMCGIMAGHALYGIAPLWMWMLSSLAVLAMAVCAVLWSRSPSLQSLLCLAVVFVGSAWRTCAVLAADDISITGTEETYEAIVAQRPVQYERCSRCRITVASGRMAGHDITAFFAGDTGQKLAVGDGLFVESRVDTSSWRGRRTIQTFVAPGHFRPYSVGMHKLPLYKRLTLRMLRLRDRLLQRYAGGHLSYHTYAVVAAMTLGDRSALSSSMRDTYAVSGASHILALSGLHLGMIYGLLSMLLVWRRTRVASTLAVIVAMWAYALLVGMSASVVRSATMFSLLSFFQLLYRSSMSIGSLSAAAVVLLAASPMSLWDVSFQMSFMAVLGILMFNSRFPELFANRSIWWHRPLRYVWQVFTVSMSAQIAVAPLVAYYFGRFSSYFLLANFVAVPLAAVILCVSVAMLAASPLPWLASGIGFVLEYVVGTLNASLSWIASLPGASVEGLHMRLPQLLLVYALVAVLYRLSFYLERLWRVRAIH